MSKGQTSMILLGKLAQMGLCALLSAATICRASTGFPVGLTILDGGSIRSILSSDPNALTLMADLEAFPGVQEDISIGQLQSYIFFGSPASGSQSSKDDLESITVSMLFRAPTESRSRLARRFMTHLCYQLMTIARYGQTSTDRSSAVGEESSSQSSITSILDNQTIPEELLSVLLQNLPRHGGLLTCINTKVRKVSNAQNHLLSTDHGVARTPPNTYGNPSPVNEVGARPDAHGSRSRALDIGTGLLVGAGMTAPAAAKIMHNDPDSYLQNRQELRDHELATTVIIYRRDNDREIFVGNGVILNKEAGWIATNAHNLRHSDEFVIRFRGRNEALDADVVVSNGYVRNARP